MNTSALHVVLGASGAVGRHIIKELQNRNVPVRAVARSPLALEVETIPADLLDADATRRAVSGASHVYLCVGLPYQAKVWQRDWPRLMQNVVDACAAEQAKLLFLDNVYSYGPPPLPTPFDERTSLEPVSQKGKVRKATLAILEAAGQRGEIAYLIGRAADFYGPAAVNSMFYISFLERMLQGKAPMALGKPDVPHTYANVADLGRAMVELALADDADGQVWHLPVGPATTVEEMAALFNRELGADFKVSYLPAFLRKAMGWFVPAIRELEEMMYQFEQPYVMSWEKFRTRFPDFRASSYEEGVKEMVAWFTPDTP